MVEADDELVCESVEFVLVAFVRSLGDRISAKCQRSSTVASLTT